MHVKLYSDEHGVVGFMVLVDSKIYQEIYFLKKEQPAKKSSTLYSTYKTSSPQASQKGVLVSSTGCVDGGLVGDLFHSGCLGGPVEVGDTAAGDAVDGNFCDGLRCGGPEGC